MPRQPTDPSRVVKRESRINQTASVDRRLRSRRFGRVPRANSELQSVSHVTAVHFRFELPSHHHVLSAERSRGMVSGGWTGGDLSLDRHPLPACRTGRAVPGTADRANKAGAASGWDEAIRWDAHRHYASPAFVLQPLILLNPSSKPVVRNSRDRILGCWGLLKSCRMRHNLRESDRSG